MPALRVHVLEHAESTPPGTVLDWLKSKGHAATIVRLWNGDSLPAIEETDWLILLGGPMNVDQVDEYPWLAEEKLLLKAAVEKKIACLGLCLGGQLLAQALGGEVKKNTEWEAGWHTVHFGATAAPDSRLMVFEWHEDTFTLPPGAVRVATNRTSENQGFAFGDRVVGLQFHPEATEDWIRSKIEEGTVMPVGSHVQTREQIVDGLIFLTPLKKWFFDLLGRLELIASNHVVAAGGSANLGGGSGAGGGAGVKKT